jgi:hypothetical protein
VVIAVIVVVVRLVLDFDLVLVLDLHRQGHQLTYERSGQLDAGRQPERERLTVDRDGDRPGPDGRDGRLHGHPIVVAYDLERLLGQRAAGNRDARVDDRSRGRSGRCTHRDEAPAGCEERRASYPPEDDTANVRATRNAE